MTLWLLPIAPLAGALAVLALGRATRDPVRLTTLALLVISVTLGAGLWASVGGEVAHWPLWGARLAPRLAAEGLGRTMVVLVPGIALPVVLFAGSYSRAEPALARLLALLTAFIGFMELLVLAGDFLTLLVAWELVGACSWALIGFDWRDARAPRAAGQAFLTTRVGDLGLYVAAGAAFAATGALGFDALATAGAPALHVVAAGALLAAAAKSAQLPFTPWLFSAMAGPTPASALLHSATMVAAGAYLLARLGPVLAPVPWFGPAVALLGLATALAGGIVASVQADLKRALAASTSAQYGLMLVAVGSGFPGAAGVHLVAHAFFKALLFLAAGSVSHAAGTLDLSALGRAAILRARPRLAALAAIGALALAAVPPLGAAFSKEYIVVAATQARTAPVWLAAGVFAAALLSAFYAARLWLLAFGPGTGRSTDPVVHASSTVTHGATTHRTISRTPRAELTSMAALAAVSVLLGAWYLPGGERLSIMLAGGRLPHEGSAMEIALSAAVAAAGIGGAWWLWRRRAPAVVGLPALRRAWIAEWFGLSRAAERVVVGPTLALARGLAAVDGRAVDAGVRLAARTAWALSRMLGWWGERGFTGFVTATTRGVAALARSSRAADDRVLARAVAAVAWGTTGAALLSRRTDDDGVDRAVETLAQEVGALGTWSRRLQTGLAHDYYLIASVGVVVLAVAAAVAVVRSYVR